MGLLIKRAVVLAKIETTYNTDSVPTATADAVLVENLQYAPAEQRMYQQPTVGATLAMVAQVYGGSLLQVTFDVALKGSGALGTAPDVGVFLRACGIGETISAGVSVTYKPVSASQESITIYLYEDGKRYVLTGVRGNVSFSGTVGEPGKLSFTLTGHWTSPATVTLPTPTLDATIAPVLLSAGFTVNSYSAVISAFSYDLGNTVAFPPDINAPDGFSEIIITGRDVNGSIDPEEVLVATQDFVTLWKSGTPMAMSTGVIGANAGNRWQKSLPKITYRDWATGDRDGVRTAEMPFGAEEVNGDDEISLVFT